MAFLLLIGVSGLLLTWKDELKLNPTSNQIESNHTLIGLDAIETIALNYADTNNLDRLINRIDYRPAKGIAKVRFEHHFTEVQINCYTGDIISTKQRTADIIEMIHDGSIIDHLFKSRSENVKLLYSTLTSLGLILLGLSGFMLWLRPKQIKGLKHRNR